MTTRSSPPPPPQAPRPKPRTESQNRVVFGGIPKAAGHRIVLFGPGGVGKTTLAATAPGPVAFFDLDDSLGVLSGQLDALNIRSVNGADTWLGILDALYGGGWDDIKTVVVDSATKAEELAIEHTLKTVPHEKGNKVERLEDYGFGKGYTYVYETFLALLNALNLHTRAGRHVILICHDCTATVPNPSGEDYLRFEPRLQSPASGKSSIRLRVKEWSDHLLFLGYDVDVKDGKGRGSGTRTVYPNELPHCMAKSRTMSEPLPLVKFETKLWTKLFGVPGE